MLKPVVEDGFFENEMEWIIVVKDRFLVPNHNSSTPKLTWEELDFLHHYKESALHLVHEDDEGSVHEAMVIDIGSEHIEVDDWHDISLRSLLMNTSARRFGLYSKAWQYTHFVRTHQYCGRCGNKMQAVDWEMAMHCHQCHHRCYPRVSPCIIVAIYRGDDILLARGVRHKESNMYSTLAGFVESGESLENAVHREVFEEVGVKIKNLRYFGSQPWPFPHSLMAGFIAEYVSGNIKIDDKEIDDAQWFSIHDLPFVPPTFSIAGQLIEKVVMERKNQK